MAVAFGPEQFRQAASGLTQGEQRMADADARMQEILANRQARQKAEAEAEPEGEFGQYGTRSAEREAFEAYVKAVAPNTGMRTLRVLFGAFEKHGLYAGWVKIGRPIDPGVKPISPADVERLTDIGIDPGTLTEAGIPLPPEPTAQERINAILAAQGPVDEVLKNLTDDPEIDPVTGKEGFWGPDGQFWEKDEFGVFRVTDFDPARRTQPLAAAPPTELTPFQQTQEARQRQEFIATEQRLFKEREATRLFREQQFGFQEEGRRLEQERFQQGLTAQREERLAQLAAQPISWLQHAALSGQTPVVQPWMIPLMRPGQNLQVGQPLPGFQAGLPGGAIQQGGFLPGTATPAPVGNIFANLPELRRPSAQLFARMGPTEQRQYLGFRQAGTGIPPEETLFRQRQTGPPGSSGGGFQQQRLRV